MKCRDAQWKLRWGIAGAPLVKEIDFTLQDEPAIERGREIDRPTPGKTRKIAVRADIGNRLNIPNAVPARFFVEHGLPFLCLEDIPHRLRGRKTGNGFAGAKIFSSAQDAAG